MRKIIKYIRKNRNNVYNMNDIIDKTIWDFIKNKKDIDTIKIDMLSHTAIKTRVNNIKLYKSVLNELLKIPLIKQRTPEWFELRKNRLTASNLGDAVANNNLLFAKKKAGVIIDNTNYSAIPALKFGTMFEAMAARCYSQKNDDILIHEFGMIPHKTLDNFGASPDGINELGIMLEIKCLYSRKIKNGVIPPKYYLQIQGQLAVCELKECDYIECDFSPLNKEEYLNLIDENQKINHGIIIEYKKDGEYYYDYSNPYLTPKEALENINKKNHDYFVKYTYWKLNEMYVQRVIFDETKWNNELVPKINNFWEKVIECRNLPIEEERVIKKEKVQFIQDDD